MAPRSVSLLIFVFLLFQFSRPENIEKIRPSDVIEEEDQDGVRSRGEDEYGFRFDVIEGVDQDGFRSHGEDQNGFRSHEEDQDGVRPLGEDKDGVMPRFPEGSFDLFDYLKRQHKLADLLGLEDEKREDSEGFKDENDHQKESNQFRSIPNLESFEEPDSKDWISRVEKLYGNNGEVDVIRDTNMAKELASNREDKSPFEEAKDDNDQSNPFAFNPEDKLDFESKKDYYNYGDLFASKRKSEQDLPYRFNYLLNFIQFPLKSQDINNNINNNNNQEEKKQVFFTLQNPDLPSLIGKEKDGQSWIQVYYVSPGSSKNAGSSEDPSADGPVLPVLPEVESVVKEEFGKDTSLYRSLLLFVGPLLMCIGTVLFFAACRMKRKEGKKEAHYQPVVTANDV